jgi:hypothetical protein
VSIVGLVKDTAKGLAVAGTVISGATALFFLLGPLIAMLCKFR